MIDAHVCVLVGPVPTDSGRFCLLAHSLVLLPSSVCPRVRAGRPICLFFVFMPLDQCLVNLCLSPFDVSSQALPKRPLLPYGSGALAHMVVTKVAVTSEQTPSHSADFALPLTPHFAPFETMQVGGQHGPRQGKIYGEGVIPVLNGAC